MSGSRIAASACYVADSLGKRRFLGGLSFACWDMLAGLVEGVERVDVVSGDPEHLPEWLDDLSRRPTAWHSPPEGVQALDPVIDGTLPSRAFRWFRDARANTAYLRGLKCVSPDVLWVEGLSGHRFGELQRSWDGVRRKAMILQSSPEQWNGTFSHLGGDWSRVRKELLGYPFMVSVSENVSDLWRAEPGFESLTYLYVPNTAREGMSRKLQATSRAEVRKRLGVTEDRLLVVCPATVQYRKGQDVLFRALAESRARLPPLRVVCIGSVMTDRGASEILRLRADLGLADCVDVLGQRPDALEWMYAADIVALPSREEGMPLALLEAMVLGTPIVSTRVCGIPELIPDDAHGRIADAGDVTGFAKGIVDLAGNAQLRFACATAAASRYDVEFSHARQRSRIRDAVRLMLEQG